MGDVVELTSWRATRRAAGTVVDGGSDRPTTGRTRPRARVRPIPPSWHPSLGDDAPHDTWPGDGTTDGSTARDGHGLDAITIARLDRAVVSIDRATSRIAERGGRLAPDVETELLALVGQISLGLIAEAADRAERMARGLGGAASSGP